MRQSRTDEERAAIERLRSTLESEGAYIVDDGAFTDRPDWVFDYDGRRIGAECTCINVAQLMQWSNPRKRWEDGAHYEVRFANEPHLWVKRAIDAKASKVPEYKQRARCAEVWLILHSEFTRLPLFACPPSMLELMRGAAAAGPGGFDSIWFVHVEAGACRLWQVGDSNTAFPELDLSHGYPTLRVRQGRVTLTPERGEFSLGLHNPARTLVIQPLDERYRID